MLLAENSAISSWFQTALQRCRVVCRHHVFQAGLVVETCFPPATEDDAFRVLTALNLLNAAVKQPGGAELVSYAYIKGMAACLFVHLLLHPLPGVEPYWDADERIAYFRVRGWQVSFHYVLFTPTMRRVVERSQLRPQTWDGLRLQMVAADLFLLANPQAAFFPCEQMATVHPRLLHSPRWQPLIRYHYCSLGKAFRPYRCRPVGTDCRTLFSADPRVRRSIRCSRSTSSAATSSWSIGGATGCRCA